MTCDSSALVAAFAPWHERHDKARHVLREVSDLVAHAELEAYSVLTRLPTPFRAAPGIVAAYLRQRHPGARLVLPGARRRSLVERLSELSISGGGVYDALVAATAAHHGEALVSCDRRAGLVYERLDVAVELL
ncbi:MAG: type II toxin-antitoxin system VapC family toxin [Actinobacteria bacterium]|nr:MAG: type II toxin-antitoxin system VapC family toxin [Actinomycetota bacterium]